MTMIAIPLHWADNSDFHAQTLKCYVVSPPSRLLTNQVRFSLLYSMLTPLPAFYHECTLTASVCGGGTVCMGACKPYVTTRAEPAFLIVVVISCYFWNLWSYPFLSKLSKGSDQT